MKAIRDKILVSVLISTFDRIDFLSEAIESILNQDFQDFEIIIVVEFCESSKKVIDLLKTFNDPRIRIIKNTKKLGFAESLNVGMAAAKGKYIARMDDDDISLPNRLKEEFEYLEKNKDVDIVGSSIKTFGESNFVFPQPIHHEELKVKVLFETPVFHPTVMFRKQSFIKNNLLYNKDYITEDYELWSRAINKIKFANISKVLLNYRISNTNMTSTRIEQINNIHLSIMKKQFQENFGLNFELEDLKVIRKAFNGWPMPFRELKKLNSIKSKIFKVNNEKKYCNKLILKRYLNYKVNLSKKIFQKLNQLL